MKQLQHTAPVAWEAHFALVAQRRLGFGVCKELPGLSSISTPQYVLRTSTSVVRNIDNLICINTEIT